jgi:hypothetical protein
MLALDALKEIAIAGVGPGSVPPPLELQPTASHPAATIPQAA